MKCISTRIEGLYIIEPRVFTDARGYFFESFNQATFEKYIGSIRFVQDNESFSRYGVVRGLHYQRGEFAQAKLLRVVRGGVLDVAVDLREGSPTFGDHFAIELTSENHRQLFIPRGFAHGFSVLTDEVVLQYKCDNLYAPQSERGIAWNDPQLAIDWNIPTDKVILSDKDKLYSPLSEIDKVDLFEYKQK